ncbi:MAG: PilZ domain-containing protein [Rhodanobacteraceae bacterium]
MTNVITGESMGCIGNISHTGVMLIGPAQPESNAVYQVILPLPWDDGSTLNLEVGVQGQWFQQAASAKQYWAGYRIVAISDQDNADLLAWLDQPD